MKRISLYLGLLALAAPSLFIVPAQAQATRTWISGVGDDANPCSRTAPCKTFPGAISQTAAGGEIDTLDPGGFGAVTVIKAITLADEGVGEGGILVAGTNGITVNCATDPNCTVVVRGLQIDGGPVGSNSLNGIKFIAGAKLQVENCVIRNFTGGSPNGYGIQFTPSGLNSELDVTNSVISNNGQAGGSGIGGGIFVYPQPGGSAKGTITRTQLPNNSNGIRLDNSLAAGASSISVQDTVVSNSLGQGIAVQTPASGGFAGTIMLHHVTSSNNAVDGLISNGQLANIYVGDSVITNNTSKGVAVSNSGVITTYKNNQINGNGLDNTAVMTAGGLQ